ncbi:glycosyltransferase [Dyella sp. C9]|uniref:glycosyltransferase n=1 Tax=Dyella sp. C9 TaxID=2202154 RepID=UPI000DEF8D3B|nr:glycosyltransferase [Dyella sp. C9]
MNNVFAWRLSRLIYFVRRVKGSIAQRGWHGAFKRLVQQRQGLRSMLWPRAEASALPVPAITDREGARRLLVIESMVPDPVRDSGSMRLSHMLGLLHEDGWRIDFIAADGFATPDDVVRLADLGVHYQPQNPLDWLRREGGKLDAVMLSRLPVAAQYLDVVRQQAPRATIVFDTVDLHFVREQRAAALTGNARLLRHAVQSRKHEIDAISRSDVTLVVSPEEQATLARELPGARVELVSNIHEVYGRKQGFKARKDLLFVGGFGHPPNADAVRWFADEILPLLRAQEPALVLHVAGDIDDASRRSLTREGLRIHGRVGDIAPLMEQCRVSVAPLRFGAGVKGKVNLAMSYGLPVVVTSIAAEGMHLEDRVNAMIGDGAEAFAQAVLQVYRDEGLWSRLSDASLQNVHDHFSVEQARASLRRVFSVIDPTPRA